MSAGGRHLKDEGSQRQAMLAGAFAGLFSRFCIAPLDVIKINMQLQTHALSGWKKSEHGAASIVRRIWRNDGIRGFWRGNVPAELLYLTYGSVQFSTYRTCSRTLSQMKLPDAASAFFSGAAAGAAATTATYPLDLLRTRFAAQGSNKIYRSFLGSIRMIAREEGARGFFRGIGAGVGQVVPYMGLFFSSYESLRPVLAPLQLPFGSGDAMAGIVAGVVAKSGVFPLDLIRKRLQVQGPGRGQVAGGAIPEYGRGVLKTGRAIVAREGWRGLYKGLGVSLVKAAPASAVTMWSYEVALGVLIDAELAK